MDTFLSPATAESYIDDFMTVDEMTTLHTSRPYTSMPWLHVFRRELYAMQRVCAIVVEPDYNLDNFAIQAADFVIDLTQVPFTIIKRRGL